MLRNFLIILNLFVFSLWKLLFPVSVTVTQTAPFAVQANNSFMVQVAINKGDLKGIAKFTEKLPIGFTAVPIDNEGAKTSYNNNIIQFSWDSLPSSGILNISFRVDVGALSVAFKDTLIGKFLYTVDDQKLETDCSPSYINVSGVTVVQDDGSRQVDSIKTCLGGIFVSRRFPSPSIAANTSVKISLVLHKAGITGFAKIEDSLPPGFTATAIDANGASFTLVDNIAKFVWQNIPSDSILTISYLASAGPDVSGIHVISGNFSYIYNSTPYTCSIGSTIFNTTHLKKEIANTTPNNPPPVAATDNTPPAPTDNATPNSIPPPVATTDNTPPSPVENTTPTEAPAAQTQANAEPVVTANVAPSVSPSVAGVS